MTVEKYDESIVDVTEAELAAGVYGQLTITSRDGLEFDIESKLPFPARDRLIVLVKFQNVLDLLGGETAAELAALEGPQAVFDILASYDPEDQAERDAEEREREADLFDNDGARGAEKSDTEGGETDAEPIEVRGLAELSPDAPEPEPYYPLGN